jgi:hypothetical protein
MDSSQHAQLRGSGIEAAGLEVESFHLGLVVTE